MVFILSGMLPPSTEHIQAQTPGYIPIWLADLLLGDSVISQSDNGNIGIGTAAPIASIEARRVTESYGTTAIMGASFTNTMSVPVPSLIRGGVTGIGLHNYTTPSLWNVGILGFVPSGGHTATAGGFYAQKWNGTDWTTTARAARVIGNDYQFFLGEVAQSDMSITRADLVADTSGNVGIGTFSPQAKLEVAGGDLRVSGDIYARGQLVGQQGPPGIQGPPGPPVRTVAACTASQFGCSCSGFSRLIVGIPGPCSVTSDTGTCTVSGAGTTGPPRCCVCVPQ